MLLLIVILSIVDACLLYDYWWRQRDAKELYRLRSRMLEEEGFKLAEDFLQKLRNMNAEVFKRIHVDVMAEPILPAIKPWWMNFQKVVFIVRVENTLEFETDQKKVHDLFEEVMAESKKNPAYAGLLYDIRFIRRDPSTI